MTAPFTSPAPWVVNASGGARTIVARDRSVVAVVCGDGSAAPFDVGNSVLLAAAPDLREALQALLVEVEASGNGDARDFGWGNALRLTRAALAKSEQDGGAPEDGPVETGTGV